MKRTIALSLLCLVALSLQLAAQGVYVLDSAIPGGASSVYLPSPAYPVGGAGPLGVVPMPASGLLAPGPVGGMAIDQTTGFVYSTDGFGITVDANPIYLPFAAAFPILPLPAPAPPLLGGLPINGMSVDSIAGILWMTDGVSVGGFTLGLGQK